MIELRWKILTENSVLETFTEEIPDYAMPYYTVPIWDKTTRRWNMKWAVLQYRQREIPPWTEWETTQPMEEVEKRLKPYKWSEWQDVEIKDG